MSATYHAAQAWLPVGLTTDVLLTVDGGRFSRIDVGDAAGDVGDAAGDAARADPIRLPGIVLPGLANCHSHAFHRAIRGRTHDGAGDFWTWRRLMYEVAAALDPDSYYTLARATYTEMVLAGYSTVGEFHYLHHAPGGKSYDDPNAMGHALLAAAADAGIRLTLLDTCYLAGGLGVGGHLPLDDVQRRFADATVDAWAARVDSLRDGERVRIGRAAHSVRAVPAPDLMELGLVHRQSDARPLHVHVSEQSAENDACRAHYGRTPTQLLAECGVLGPTSTAVHATHLVDMDIALLKTCRTTVCFCPTTERDLADGIGPAGALAAAGVHLSLGSDQHTVIDPFEEMRGLEMNERLATGRRGTFDPRALLGAATDHASLGWPDVGRIEVGARADLVAVNLDSARTAGCDPAQLVFAASAADVDTVIVDGRVVVSDGHHLLGDVGGLLGRAIADLR